MKKKSRSIEGGQGEKVRLKKKAVKANDGNYTAWSLEELHGVARPYRLMVLALEPEWITLQPESCDVGKSDESSRCWLLSLTCCCCIETKIAPAAPCCTLAIEAQSIKR